MKSKNIINALKAGKEIVIIANDPTFYSSVFWKEGNVIYTFSRGFSIFPRTIGNDFSYIEFEKHIENMLKENAKIYVRG